MAAIVLPGCAPYLFEITPPISGVVLDGKDATPIKGAKVCVIAEANKEHPEVAAVTTDGSGAFDLPRTTRWGVYVVPQEPYAPIGYSLKVEAEGYQRYYVPLGVDYHHFRGDEWQDVAIRLKRGQ